MAPVAAVLAALAAAAPAAIAAVGRAESVLPPGESGFVRDLATGTGSPHLYDQFQLFVNFNWKPATFRLPGAPSAPKPGVTIVRDKYGVPDVTGTTDANAWWGVGYAAAQDRLTELELFRRRATGHLAEILGPSSLPGDVAARRDFPTAPELDSEVAALPAPLRVRLVAYRDGINAWIQHVRAHPQDMPAEFAVLGVPLRDWTVRDSAAIGALLVRTVPSAGDGRELQNARALQLMGKARFARLVPLHVKDPPLIVPPADGAFPSQPGRTASEEQAAFDRSAAFASKLPIPSSTPRAASRTALGRPGGSIAVAVRSPTGPLLYSAPQVGFAFPEQLWEVEVHRPGLDVRGVTAPGVPVVAGGFNHHVAWAVTSGESDVDDLYADRVVGGGESYRFDGKVLKMKCRTATFAYRSGSGEATTTRRLCRTRHGPVQARAGGFAYARRYATFGRELQSLVGVDELDRAASVQGVDTALRDVTWNENVTAIDDRGHIGFWHPGLLPLRPLGFDERLPYPGGGRAEWRGFLPVAQRPHAIDPARGWLANWNNQPSAGWTSGDAAARGRLDGPLNRAAFLYTLVRKLARQPSFAGLEGLVHHSATTVEQRPLLTGRLEAALAGSTGKARAVLATILAWDGSFARQASNGTVDPGVATWEAFKRAAERIALRPFGPGAVEVDGENADYHFFDASNGIAFALRTLSPAGYRRAAVDAFGGLAQRFGTTDPKKWRAPRHYYAWIQQGLGKPPPLPFFERGTYEQLLQLK